MNVLSDLNDVLISLRELIVDAVLDEADTKEVRKSLRAAYLAAEEAYNAVEKEQLKRRG